MRKSGKLCLPVTLVVLQIIERTSVPFRFRVHAQDPRGVFCMSFASPLFCNERAVLQKLAASITMREYCLLS
jgi:hypothetical protein